MDKETLEKITKAEKAIRRILMDLYDEIGDIRDVQVDIGEHADFRTEIAPFFYDFASSLPSIRPQTQRH